MNKFLALSSMILAFFVLDVPTIKAEPLNFTLVGVSSRSYRKFIETKLRPELPFQKKVYNIPVLLPNIEDSKRFLLIDLTNFDSQTITLAVDVLNVYVVAYRTGGVSYFLKEPTLANAFELLFKGTRREHLDYSGNYKDLEEAAGSSKEKIPLGFPALDAAITNMISHNNYRAVAKAFIIIIQTMAEAARFQSIEVEIATIPVDGSALPSASMLSLETQWSALSKNIQYAETNGGKFQTPVKIINDKGEEVTIKDADSNVVKSNIKLLLNSKVSINNCGEAVEAIIPSNCGYTMGRKWINDGYENYVTM